MANKTYEELIKEALAAKFSGWDFSYIRGRWHEEDPPWDYLELVQQYAAGKSAMLDIDTGGGEFLARLPSHPPHTDATEGWPPNVNTARRQLEPLGIRVIETEPHDAHNRHLPIPPETYDIVINRHGSFDAYELHRIMKPGGIFITQQVGSADGKRLNELLSDEPAPDHSKWNAGVVVHDLLSAGYDILRDEDVMLDVFFYDIGALAYYLKIITWQIPDFDVMKEHARLRMIHPLIEQDGYLRVQAHRFLVIAQKQ